MLDRFRDKDLVQAALAEIHKITTRPWAIMEICGGQTHAIMQYGSERPAAQADRTHSRPRLSGMRHLAGIGG